MLSLLPNHRLVFQYGLLRKLGKKYYEEVSKDALKWATKNDGKMIFENTLSFILDKLNR